MNVRGKSDDGDGDTAAPVGGGSDSVERQRAEARLAGIVSIAADAIISIDGSHRITLFNDGASFIFGYEREEIIGQPLEVLLPERFRVAHAGQINLFASSGLASRRMANRSELYGRRKSGHEFPAEASISKLKLDGETHFTVVLRDISERKQAQEQLARSHSELEARIDERTRDLNAEMQRREQIQAQLVRTQRMEAFGQLTGGVAHDFNNLLTVITGNLELLEMRLKDEKDRDFLKRAYDAAEMGARLTARLLTFARRRQYETARLNLNDQVKKMIDLLERTLDDQITLETQFAPDIWTVRADPSEIENAVLNLAINARDAMPKGGRLIVETANIAVGEGQVGAMHKLAAGEYVRLSVCDNGTGMTADVQQHAFEPFFTTKQPGRGTGLGLSSIYGFSLELGGTVTIDSEPGRGTSVHVYLPRSDGEQVARPDGHAGEGVVRSTGEKILLVEDNAEVRQITRQRLVELGYSVIDASDGTVALSILQQQQSVDLVFSDIVMSGGMSGFDLASWVRSNRPSLKLLLTTGYADEAVRAQAPHLKDVSVLRKPYTMKELGLAIRQILES